MSEFNPKYNEGVLFRNENKRKESDYDYSGSWFDANGVEHWFNGWINTSKNGKTYMKVKQGSPKADQAPAAPAPAPAPVEANPEDIPF